MDSVECRECAGMGYFEGPIKCSTGTCDWCGGCVEEYECETCEGMGEVERDEEG